METAAETWLMRMTDFVHQWWPSLLYLLEGARLTLILTTLSVGLGVVFGTVVGLCRVLQPEPVDGRHGLARVARSLLVRLIRWLAGVYVDFFRGTPLLVQILLVFYGIPAILPFIQLDAFTAGVIALSVNSGAYVGEIVRAGIQSIDPGQMEAALATGLTGGQAMWYVILPQALRRMIPPLGNEFVALLKDSSLVAAISLEELLRRSQLLMTRTFRPFEVFLMTAVIYLIMTKAVSIFVGWVERRTRTGRQRAKTDRQPAVVETAGAA